MPRARRDAAAVFLALAGGSSGLFALVTTLNLLYQATVVGLSPLQLVLVGTTLEAVVFLAEVPTGIVADLYSRRLSILIGLVLIGFGWLLEGGVPHFGAVLGAQVLWGVGYTFTSGADHAWITDEIADDTRVAHTFVRGTRAELAATVVGILLAAGLGAIWIRLPILLGGAGFLLLAALLAAVMPERNFHRTPDAERTTFAAVRAQVRAGTAMARRGRVVRVLLLISLVDGLASEAFDRLWVVHLLGVAGLGDRSEQVLWFAGINLIGTLLALLTSAAIGRVSPRTLVALHPTRLLATLAAMTVGAVLVFALAGSILVLVPMLWIRTIAGALARPVSAAWMNRQLDSSARATVLSFESQLNAVGQVAGGPVLGWVGSAYSVRAALLASAAVLSPVVALYARATGSPRTQADRAHL